MLRQAVFLFVLFVVGSIGIARAQRVEAVPIRQAFSEFPRALAEWRGRDNAPLSERELEVLGADDYLLRTYFAPDKSAHLYVGYWESQKRGDAVHSPLNCIPGSGWEPLSNRPLKVAVRDSQGVPSDIQVNRYVIQKGLDKQLVLGLNAPEMVLLLLTFVISMLTFGTGRTNILFGIVHMLVFSVFLFMVFVP